MTFYNRVTRLSLTKYFRNHRLQSVSRLHAYPFCKTTPGTGRENLTICLWVSLTKSSNGNSTLTIRETRLQFVIFSRPCFVSETREKRSPKYLVSESQGAPAKQLSTQITVCHLTYFFTKCPVALLAWCHHLGTYNQKEPFKDCICQIASFFIKIN